MEMGCNCQHEGCLTTQKRRTTSTRLPFSPRVCVLQFRDFNGWQRCWQHDISCWLYSRLDLERRW